LLSFLILGTALVGIYIFDPLQTKLIPSDQGFAIYVSTNVNVTAVQLALRNWGDQPLVSVLVWCECPKDPFNVMMILPFTVTSGYAPWPWPLIPSPGVWHFVNDGNATSIVYNSTQVNASYGFFQTSFPVRNYYLTSRRGIETLQIQLNTGVGGTPTFEKLFNQLGVGFVTLHSISVYITIPASARDLQAFPETSSRKPLPKSLTGNTIVDSIQWDLTERATITLSYVDDDVAGSYEAVLIIGSIVLGAGVSEGLDLLMKKT
jgi:hypothetical protein